jgi:hypothetical protein
MPLLAGSVPVQLLDRHHCSWTDLVQACSKQQSKQAANKQQGVKGRRHPMHVAMLL